MNSTNWPYPIVYLKPGKEFLSTKKHPWIYSGALSNKPEAPLVRLACPNGHVFAVGTASSVNPISVRIFHWIDAPIDELFFRSAFECALKLRNLFNMNYNNIGCRWLFGEGDGVPGLVIDRYGPAIVVQVGTLGLEVLRNIWLPILFEFGQAIGASIFVERSYKGRKEEGLNPETRILKGSVDKPIIIKEGNALLSVDLLKGQKTGMFLDQRNNRLFLGQISNSCTVLNAFGYTGGFSIHAGLGGAKQVVTLDSSRFALEQAQNDWLLNGLNPSNHSVLQGNAFDIMRSLPKEIYDRVIIDPPAFAKQHKDLENAFKAYKDIFRLGANLTSKNGILGCFSCSQHMSHVRFQDAIWTAILEAGREAQIISHSSQPIDHPYAINHLEGLYLKGVWLRIY